MSGEYPSQVRAVVDELVRRRKARSLTIAEVASRAGMSPTQVIRVEQADHVPTITTLIKHARGLGLHLTIEVH